MMSSDEEDYMSDAFLAQCSDVRPGLKRTHATQRDHEMHKKKAKIGEKKSKAQLETEQREEGLNKALDHTNKGFSMMAKMGFKMGQSLGKNADEGRKEPIEVKVKADRAGLGIEAVKLEMKELRRKKLMKKRAEALNVDEFRAQLSKRRKFQLITADLAKSQRVCQDLDKVQEVQEPVETWFWPKLVREDDEDDDDEEEEEEFECEFDAEEQLSILTTYLRKQYLYCLWCGHSFDDQSDLDKECPGMTRCDHDD